MSKACSETICNVGQKGVFLPMFGDDEQRWEPNGLRAVLYGAGLLWFFAGVGIGADVFMGAVETITSKKKQVVDPETGKTSTVFVWNDTVANLTLMALGSSAPEILLSVIELLSSGFKSGDLGPSTIVGSAAFNMLCISAVCVSAIPAGEIRKIEDTSVFAITASVSIIAYLWLLLIVSITSVNEVEIWEAVITFLMFPMLVCAAYAADQGMISAWIPHLTSGKRRRQVDVWEMSREEVAMVQLEIERAHQGINLTPEQMVRLLEARRSNFKSRAGYRQTVTNDVLRSGTKKLPLNNKEPKASLQAVVPTDSSATPTLEPAEGQPPNFLKRVTQHHKSSQFNPDIPRVEFACAHLAVMEHVGSLEVKVLRLGAEMHRRLSVHYKTRDGTAKSAEDYIAVDGVLEFAPQQTEGVIKIGIVDDKAYEVDEDFFLELSNPSLLDPDDSTGGSAGNSTPSHGAAPAVLGDKSVCQIHIIDDDEANGELYFAKDAISVTDGAEIVRLPVVVHRKNGSAGNIACTYYTEQDSAVKDVDYEHAEGRLEFTPGQVSAELTLNILPRGRYEKKEIFRLYLADPQGGARFDETTDGGSENCILTVTIAPEEGRKTIVDNLLSVVNQDQLRQGNRTYKQQLLSAIFPDAGDDEDGEPQSRSERAMQLVMHVLLLPWNIFFALIPPPEYCGGWLCFSLSLVAIGFVTAMIGDLAALFGCVMSLPDGITAITFVALGTSLPDTFASKTAAEQDPSADASVGNVTGSNSVNVFLGLGLPWTIGAVYWRLAGRNADWQEEYRDHGDFALWNQGGGKFVVVGGDLGFSVAVFTGCAVCCLLILAIRRSLFGGELGGPKRYAYLSSCIMVLLWVLYIALSSWKIMQSYKC